ncbi:MAG: 2TM domain-containing protein [Rhizobiaceae bacterium]
MGSEDPAVSARRRAKAKFGFYVHVTVYAAVIILLFVINLITSPGSYWVIWPLAGWGIAVVIHATSVFGAGHKAGIIDRMADKEMGKQQWGRGSPTE